MKRFPPVPTHIRECVAARDLYVCKHRHCFCRSTEIAHRIAKTWANASEIRRLVAELYDADVDNAWVIYNVIHHPANLVCSCREHNDSFNIGNRPESVREMVKGVLDRE